MSTRGILAWFALALGLPTAADYGLIPYILAEGWCHRADRLGLPAVSAPVTHGGSGGRSWGLVAPPAARSSR
jgi:hypothetical protein